MKFKAITTNYLDERIGISTITAKDSGEAWEIIEEGSHNYDRTLLLTTKQYKELKRLII